MLPGKKYLPEDYLHMVWRRKWFLIVPAVLVASAVAGYSTTLPNRYESTGLVQVIGQRVPENIVQPTVTDTVADRLNQIQQQILTRTRLERIIDEFNLYAQERESGRIMEDIVQQMRTRDIRITINANRARRADAGSFNVSFTSENPRTAQAVAERLTTLFVDENSRNRATLASSTTLFLEQNLEDARRRLQEQEERVAAFKRQHAGRLPDQSNANMQVMQTVQEQIRENTDAIQRERDRLATLQGTLLELTRMPTSAVQGMLPAAQQLLMARENLRALELRLTADHPDLRQARRLIAELEQKAEQEALNAPLAPDATAAGAAGAARANMRIVELQQQIRDLELSLERRHAEDKELRATRAQYVTRIEATPQVAAQLTDLTRDYETLRAQYENFLKRSEQAQLAESLELASIGEQFLVIDTPRVPERPVSPDRVRLNLLGLAGGLGLGLGLIALLEYRDTTFKSDSDVLVSLALPVLAVIPAMVNRDERQRRRRRQRLMAAAASLAIILAGATAVAWRLRLIQDWIR